MKILYPKTGGGLAVLHPTGEISDSLVAEQDVPHGVAFLIVADAEIPADRSQREGWTADFSSPDGTGANYGAGTNWVVLNRAQDGTPITLQNTETLQEVSYADHLS